MKLILRGAVLIDGTGADPRDNTAVVVEGNRIVALDDQTPSRSSDDQVVDLNGLTLLPGLIDAHVHLGFVSFSQAALPPAAVLAAQIFRNCELALVAGFTTVRDMGAIDGGLVQAVDGGLVRGPRILPSGPWLVQTGGHGDLIPPFSTGLHGLEIPGLYSPGLVCNGPDEIRLGARTAFKRGARQLKVIISGGVASLSDNLDDTQFTVPELQAAVAEAEARSTYVAAHAHNVRAIRNGLTAGITCFEHGTFLDEPTAAEMAKAGAVVVPTLSVSHLLLQDWRQEGFPEEVVPRLARCDEATRESIKLARQAGVLVGSGTDSMGPEQNRRGLELVLKSQILSPMEAIVSATRVNSQILRVDDHLGTVAAGKLADLIAIDGDPLAEPEVFDDPTRVVLVIKNGVIIKDARSLVPSKMPQAS